MSQHKTAQSNWTAEEKKLYRERRDKGLRGQTGAVTVHRATKDEKGNEQLVPVGDTIGTPFFQFGRQQSYVPSRHSGQRQAFVRQQRKASSRGE